MPIIYQAPGCLESRESRQALRCENPRCMACYGWDADFFEECGKLDLETGWRCQLPADAPEFYEDSDSTEEYHEYKAVFTDSQGPQTRQC